MNEAAVRKRLSELTFVMTERPGPDRRASAKGEGLYLPCGAACHASIEEAFEHLRVLTKYLVFDLEATRRENRYLRQMLESRLQRDRDQDGNDDSGGPQAP